MERLRVESRIIQILEYINHPIVPTLRSSLELFSLRELGQVLDFLETGNMNTIHQFLQEKIKEYKNALSDLKRVHASYKIKIHKKQEEQERILDVQQAEDILMFD